MKHLLYIFILLSTTATAQRSYTVTTLAAANAAVKGDTVTFAKATYVGVFRPQSGVYYKGNGATVTALRNTNKTTVRCNLVVSGGVPKQVARSSGYTTYTNLGNGRILGKVGRVGDELVLRRSRWNLERSTITAVKGDTIFHNGNGGTTGFGYFVQRAAYLRDSTEWLQVGDSIIANYAVSVPQFDTVVNISGRSNVTIDGLNIEGGNFACIYTFAGSNITIKNCKIAQSGVHGIYANQTDNVTITNNTVRYCLGSGIYVRRTDRTVKSNIVITDNKVSNIATIAGMDRSGQETGRAGITGYGWDGVRIERNTVDTCGYLGIEFQGNNVIVQNNIINYTNFVKDDGAGIYTYADTIRYHNRIVRGNIVSNSIGAAVGTPYTNQSARGIYLDEGTVNVLVDSNTIFNCSDAALKGNNDSACTFIGNNCYNNGFSLAFQRLRTNAMPVTNLRIVGNQFYPHNVEYRNLMLDSTVSVVNDFRTIGIIDSNYYNTVKVTLIATDRNGRNYRTATTTVDGKGVVFSPKLYYNNLSNKQKVVYLNGVYTDAYGKQYINQFTIKPFGSIILR